MWWFLCCSLRQKRRRRLDRLQQHLDELEGDGCYISRYLFRVKSARETFSMLDTKGGRGFFLIFLGLMIPQNKNGVAIAMSVITNLIGMLNILVGYN